jgi:hypothetical protein
MDLRLAFPCSGLVPPVESHHHGGRRAFSRLARAGRIRMALFLAAAVAPSPRHGPRDEAPVWSCSGLIVDEVAGLDAEFADELGESLVRGFQAGAEDLEDLRLWSSMVRGDSCRRAATSRSVMPVSRRTSVSSSVSDRRMSRHRLVSWRSASWSELLTI